MSRYMWAFNWIWLDDLTICLYASIWVMDIICPSILPSLRPRHRGAWSIIWYFAEIRDNAKIASKIVFLVSLS